MQGAKTTVLEAKALLQLAKSIECKGDHPGILPNGPLFQTCKAAREFEFLWSKSVNLEEDSLLITILVPFFPFDQKSSNFINICNDIVDEAFDKFGAEEDTIHKNDVDDEDQIGLKFYLCGFEVGFDAIMVSICSLKFASKTNKKTV